MGLRPLDVTMSAVSSALGSTGDLSPRSECLQLLDSVSGLLACIEDFRMSEVLQGPAEELCSSGAAAVIHNAQHLVATVELWHQRGDGPDEETTQELVETVFNALHRWLSWKSVAQLPKRTASSSSSISRNVGATAREFDLLHGGPWDDCDELAAEDLLEWLAEAMPYPPTAGYSQRKCPQMASPDEGK